MKRKQGTVPDGAPISRIETWLARGGQPKGNDYRELYESGIRVVVNLRHNHDQSAEIEKRAAGLLSIRIPVRNDHAPSDEQAAKWLELCDSLHERLPIYVHCHEGHGRTSVFCALVRISQGWDFEKIVATEKEYGWEPEKLEEQTAFIRRFYDDVKAGKRRTPRLG